MELYYLLVNCTVKYKLDSDSARNTDQLGHSRVATRSTVFAESASPGLSGAILVFDTELVLQHDEISLVRGVLHLLLELGTQSVERVATGRNLLIREETDPSETRKDTIVIIAAGKSSLGRNGGLQSLLVRRSRTEDLLGGLLPGNRRLEEIGGLIAQETDINQDLNHLWESLVPQGTADDCLGFGDIVTFTEWGRVTVWVCNECKTRIDVVRLSSGHEVRAGNANFLALLIKLGGVSESQKHTAARPGELVTQWVVRAFGSRETSAVRKERGDLASFSMYLNKLFSTSAMLYKIPGKENSNHTSEIVLTAYR